MRIKELYRFLSTRHQNLFLDYKVDFRPRYGHGKPANGLLLEIVEHSESQYAYYLRKALTYIDRIQEIKKLQDEDNSALPGWNNKHLPGLDIVMLYTMIAEFKPKNYIEVGSGNSTKVVYKAVMDNNLDTKISSIDPHPRAEIDMLANTIIRQPFEEIDTNFILDLEAGDVLFIDNSHRILPNSDSMVFFMEILPKLKKGVVVQIHDVYLPYDYPQFMCDRAYSEQYGLAFYLLANAEKYKPILANYYISEKPELADIISKIWLHENLTNVERHGGSFWLQIS